MEKKARIQVQSQKPWKPRLSRFLALLALQSQNQLRNSLSCGQYDKGVICFALCFGSADFASAVGFAGFVGSAYCF
ncbi:MAG: hypothetical protein HFK04_00120 [Oscillospiraceae bacterium]|nr:hypothetical protein [Oscillospiraceae bacterium]